MANEEKKVLSSAQSIPEDVLLRVENLCQYFRVNKADRKSVV